MKMEDAATWIDESLKQNTHSQPEDPTGSDDLGPIMIGSKQIMDTARLAGFTEDQAFQIARDFLLETFRMSIRSNQ
jgi:hypothetical protein